MDQHHPVTQADIDIASKHAWFHAMRISDDLVTSGRFAPERPQNQTLFSVMDFLNDIDVADMTCLDIGATDGLISFGLEKRMARVTATDRVAGRGFDLVHRLLSSKVERIAPSEISTILDDLNGRTFDLIVCAGVIYHMLNPLSAIMACRALLKPGGLLIIETATSLTSDKAVMVLNSAEQSNMESSTYWLPTPKALTGMVSLCHFETQGGRWQNDIERGAVLGRAVEGVVPSANKLTRAMQELPLLDYSFRQQLSAANKATPSNIVFKGTRGDIEIETYKYKPHFPLHEHKIDPVTAIGKSDWKMVV